ncbi:MAG: hypothetical protein PHV06_00520 [bacterium]|nr:hypothetical protein [bacterium]
MKAKGVIFLNTLEFIKFNFGQDGLEKVLNRLTFEEQELLTLKIASVMWYPFDLYLHLSHAIIDEFYNGDINRARDFGAYVAIKGAESQYKDLIKQGTTNYVVSRAHQVQETYFDEGEMLTELAEDKKMILKLIKIPVIDPVHLLRLAGWMEKALSLSGAKEVKVDYEIKEENGKKVVYFNGDWK